LKKKNENKEAKRLKSLKNNKKKFIYVKKWGKKGALSI